MMIKVQSFFTIRQALGGQAEFEFKAASPAVWAVLKELCQLHGPEMWELLFEPETGQQRLGTHILINGRHVRHFAGGLDHELAEGDHLALFPVVGGG